MSTKIRITRCGVTYDLGRIHPRIKSVTHKLRSSGYEFRDITANALGVTHGIDNNTTKISIWECRTYNMEKITDICSNVILENGVMEEWRVCYEDHDVKVEYCNCDINKPKVKVHYLEEVFHSVKQIQGKDGDSLDSILAITKDLISGIGAWSPDVVHCCQYEFMPNTNLYDKVVVHEYLSNCDEMVNQWIKDSGVRVAVFRRDNSYEFVYKTHRVLIASPDIKWASD